MIPGLGRSPGEGNDNLLQYSCLENTVDRCSPVWQATVHGLDMTYTLKSISQELNDSTQCLFLIHSHLGPVEVSGGGGVTPLDTKLLTKVLPSSAHDSGGIHKLVTQGEQGGTLGGF